MNTDCKKVFDALVKNAFDFLGKSVSEFDSDIRYSIIHFCIAVENILKAELIYEHWSLIFKKPEAASWDKFITGDFQSVSLEEAIKRLRDIARVEIPGEAEKYFINISKERNKIIHFYNGSISKEKIAKAQFHAWYYIDKFLRTWHQHFRDFWDEKRNFRNIMTTQVGYIQLRYDKIKKDLCKIDREKLFLAACPHCHYTALVLPCRELRIQEVTCRVCDHTSRGIVIQCPDCEKLTLVADDHVTTCQCHRHIDGEDLINIIEDKYSYYADIQHGGEIDWLANCTECDGYHSVIKLDDDQWLCTSCFSGFGKVSWCEWCNELYTDEREDTYHFGCGCNFCQGYIAEHADD